MEKLRKHDVFNKLANNLSAALKTDSVIDSERNVSIRNKTVGGNAANSTQQNVSIRNNIVGGNAANTTQQSITLAGYKRKEKSRQARIDKTREEENCESSNEKDGNAPNPITNINHERDIQQSFIKKTIAPDKNCSIMSSQNFSFRRPTLHNSVSYMDSSNVPSISHRQRIPSSSCSPKGVQESSGPTRDLSGFLIPQGIPHKAKPPIDPMISLLNEVQNLSALGLIKEEYILHTATTYLEEMVNESVRRKKQNALRFASDPQIHMPLSSLPILNQSYVSRLENDQVDNVRGWLNSNSANICKDMQIRNEVVFHNHDYGNNSNNINGHDSDSYESISSDDSRSCYILKDWTVILGDENLGICLIGILMDKRNKKILNKTFQTKKVVSRISEREVRTTDCDYILRGKFIGSRYIPEEVRETFKKNKFPSNWRKISQKWKAYYEAITKNKTRQPIVSLGKRVLPDDISNFSKKTCEIPQKAENVTEDLSTSEEESSGWSLDERKLRSGKKRKAASDLQYLQKLKRTRGNNSKIKVTCMKSSLRSSRPSRRKLKNEDIRERTSGKIENSDEKQWLSSSSSEDESTTYQIRKRDMSRNDSIMRRRCSNLTRSSVLEQRSPRDKRNNTTWKSLHRRSRGYFTPDSTPKSAGKKPRSSIIIRSSARLREKYSTKNHNNPWKTLVHRTRNLNSSSPQQQKRKATPWKRLPAND